MKKKMKIKSKNRLLVFLMKMKCNITFSGLAVLFGVDRTTVSRIFYQVLEILTSATKNYIYWPPKVVVQETTPDCFKPNYSNCRVIIDATEFVVEQPQEIQERVQFFSHYKKDIESKLL